MLMARAAALRPPWSAIATSNRSDTAMGSGCCALGCTEPARYARDGVRASAFEAISSTNAPASRFGVPERGSLRHRRRVTDDSKSDANADATAKAPADAAAAAAANEPAHAATDAPSGRVQVSRDDAHRRHDRKGRFGGIVRRFGPGLLATLIAAGVSVLVGRLVPNLSPLLVAIVLGVMWRNLIGTPAAWAPGVQFSAKKLLRTGIVLLGLQVSLDEVLGLGGWTILLVVAAVSITFLVTLLVGRMLGVPLAQRILIASGFSICGAAAVAAAEGVIESKDEDVATAIAFVVVFGTLMIPLLPLAVALLSLDEHTAGLWIGASTHEVAQVVAAGGLVGGTALAVAVTVKLARVVMLAPVMAVLGVSRRRDLKARAITNATDAAEAESASASKLPPLVPLFVIGFVAAMLVRTWGVMPGPVLDAAAIVQQVLLAAAMFALGLGVHVKSMLRVGGRPVVLAASSTVLILAIGLAGAVLIPV